MEAMPRRVWVRGVLLVAAMAAAACSSSIVDPTLPPTPTPSPGSTPAPCTASAPQPMTSFAADPATIADGDAFTLRWAAPCGFVTLAQKGQGPFITLEPSTGSYALRPGLNGYPTATGNTVYEARNADTATPRETKVTVAPSCPGGCDDGNACTTDSCDNGACRHTPVNCDDGNACTTDSCDSHAGCKHAPVDCDDHNVCTTDSCDSHTGCKHTPVTALTVCQGTCNVCSNGQCVDHDQALCPGSVTACKICNNDGSCSCSSTGTVSCPTGGGGAGVCHSCDICS